MINLGQVVAALAAGALLTLALVLLLERHSLRAQAPLSAREGSDQPGNERGVQDDERERLIEACRNITVDAHEALRDRPAPERELSVRGLPSNTVVVRQKRHLGLISGLAAALIALYAGVREVMRQHGATATGAVVSTMATAAAVTTLTLMPFTAEDDATPPRLAPPAPTGRSSPGPTATVTARPHRPPVHTTAPGTPSAAQMPEAPEPTISDTAFAVASASPLPVAAPLPSGLPSAVGGTEPGAPTAGGTVSAPPASTPTASQQPVTDGLCVDASGLPLPSGDACLSR